MTALPVGPRRLPHHQQARALPAWAGIAAPWVRAVASRHLRPDGYLSRNRRERAGRRG